MDAAIQNQVPDLVRRFKQRSLGAAEFNHHNHIYVARWYLINYGLDTGAERYAKDIRQLAEALGHGNKFHATITHALLQLIEQRISSEPDADWDRFKCGNHDLFEDARGLLLERYSAATLASDVARRSIVEPDYPAGTSTQVRNCSSASRA